MVGAYYDSEDTPDQTERFLAEGIWENGYKDRYLDLVRAMKVGDKIAIKSTSTQKNHLPFDSLGHTVSLLLIKATGTVISSDSYDSLTSAGLLQNSGRLAAASNVSIDADAAISNSGSIGVQAVLRTRAILAFRRD